MTKLEMVQRAMEVLGEASPERLSAFIQKEHGESIEPRFVPIFVASLRDKMRLEALRSQRSTTPKVVEPVVRHVIPESQRAQEA